MLLKKRLFLFIIMLFLNSLFFVFENELHAANSDHHSPFCVEAHTYTDAEIEAVMPKKKTLEKLKKGVEPTNAELADNTMSLFNAQFGESLAVSGGTAALGNNLLQIPGFGFVDTYLTNVGGAIAVLQFMVDMSNEKPEAQVTFAKNASFWAVGTFKMFSRAVKITAVGIFAIDYALNAFGSTAISIRYDFWYSGYEEFYDQKHGKNMENWSNLIFGTYQGDMDRFLKEGMMEFWDKAYINKKYTKITQPKTFPTKDEQQKMKIQYLRQNKILETLKKYIKKKRAQEKKKLKKTIQNNYDKMVLKMSATTLFGGRVRDLAGNPLEGAVVRLFNGNWVKTDSAGKYEIAIKACDLYWQLVQWRKRNPGKTPRPQITASWDGLDKTREAVIQYTSLVANEADFTFDNRELSAVRISDKPITLELYDYVRLKATAEYTNGTEEDISDRVAWSTDDTSVISIQKKKIKGINTGETAVYATFSLKNKTLKSNPRKITVRQQKILEKIVLQPDALTINVTETATLKATAVYSDGTREDISKNPAFKWESDDGSIATVTGGVVKTGSLPGTCTLFVFGMGDGTTIDSNDCRITVKETLTKITVPDVTGKTKAEAETLLKSLKLVPAISTASTINPAYKPGTIISQDPSAGTPLDENDTVAATLNPDPVTTRPAIGIRVLPEEKRSYPEGTRLSFVEDIEKKTKTATYTMIWYIDGEKVKETPNIKGDAQQKNMYSHTFRQSGPHYVQLEIKSSVPGENDAIIKDIFIDETGTPNEKPLDTTTEVTPPQTPPQGEEPQILAREMNKFAAVGGKQKLEIASSYWQGGYTPARWSQPTVFRSIGAVDAFQLFTGDQSELYNAGYLVYVEKGSGKLKFEVYGFNRKRNVGRVVYSGELPTHGKKADPDSLTFHKTASRSVTPEWRAMDGSLCKVKIWKFPAGDPNSKNIMITGGVEDLGCIEPAKKAPTIQKGPFCSDPVIWSVFPSAEEMGREKIKPGKDIKFLEDIAVIYNKSWGPGIGKPGTSVGIELNLFGSPNHAKTVWDYINKTLPGNRQPLQIGQEAYILKRSRNMDHGHNSVYILYENMHIFAIQINIVSMSPEIKIKKEEPNLDGLKLMVEKIKALRCSLIPGGIKTGMEARIEEIRWKGTVWPVRLQEGKLEVRGSGYAAYQWRESWITISHDVNDFKTAGSGAGPIVAYTKDGAQWHIVMLDYASGALLNKRRFPVEITNINGGRNGATLQAGEKCYDYSLGQLREIDCKTHLYK